MSRLSFGWRRASTQEEGPEERKTAPPKYSNPFKQGTTPPKKAKKDDIDTMEDYSDFPSNFSEKFGALSSKDKSRIKNMLMSSKTYLADKNYKEQKWQYHMYEREMKKCLTDFFEDLTGKFVKDQNNKLSFYDTLKTFILKNSDAQAVEVLKDSDNLIWKSLEMVKNLNDISASKVKTSNVEKLKLYVSVLSSQLTLHNQKYFINKQMVDKVAKEREYLQKNDMYSLETQNRWCQIDVSLVSSDIAIEVQSAKKLKVGDGPTNIFCLMKVNDMNIGKTPVCANTTNPVWDTAIAIEITKDFSVEHFSFEIYNDPAAPTFIGECHIALDEILDNTLFNNKFHVYLPLSTPRKSGGSTSETPEGLKQELIDTIDEKDFDNYLNSIFHEGDNSGILKLSFQVRLDPSFTELVERLRLQRLENLETMATENDANLQEQFKYLKTSVAPIKTIEVDPSLGLVGSIPEAKPKEKKRESTMCGVCVPEGKDECNMF